MANTVNDVMNVIASPDYGIKNIAGTNQEILEILQGTHNSKNNIYNIVDDVKYLLQKLVVASTEKKPIEVSNKPQKINPKNINDILDETKNIRKSIDNLTKAVIKQSVKGSTPAVVKLTDKTSQRVADIMVKNLEKQNKGGGISALTDAFAKLKDISLIDIILGNKKIKYITKIFKTSKEDLKIKDKDLNNIIKLINASPQIINSLSKVSYKIKKIIKNDIIKKLSDILIGKISLLSISQELKKHEKVFVKSNQVMKTIRELAISLNKAMWKLLLASIWSKKSTNNISFIGSILTELISISQNLIKNKKDIDNGAKAAKSIEVLTSSLNKTMINLFFTTLWTKIISNKGVKTINNILTELISISQNLIKNKKDIDNGAKVVKSIEVLTSSLNKLFFATLWAKIISNKGVKTINNILTELISISKNLTKNKKDIDNGAKSAKNITVLAGNLLVTSIFLSITIVPALLGALGANCLSLMIDRIVVVAEKLSNKKNKKNIKNSIETAIMLTTFSGIIALSSLLLGTIAITGLPAILGSFFILGIVKINIITFKILDSASKYLEKGAKTMIIMGASLLVFGIALGKIYNATKDMSWKQLGMLGTITVGLSVCLAGLGIPTVATIVLTGSVVLTAMGASLLVFAKSLKTINDLGTVPTKLIRQVLNAMKLVKNFYVENTFKNKTVRAARRYKRIMISFASAVKNLAELKKLGSVPLKLVHQTLNAMRAIGNHYIINPISKKVINQAKKYKRMMKPFDKTIKYLSKLKNLGSVPLKFVHQTLNTMKSIADFYINNPIQTKVIIESWKYRSMLKPLGRIIKYIKKLKELGGIPRKFVYQTLNTIKSIGEFYTNNPIPISAITDSKLYMLMLKPFGRAVKYLNRLKELGKIPIKLVDDTLKAISTITNFYLNKNTDIFDGKKPIFNSSLISSIISSFSKSVETLDKLKNIKNIPAEAISKTVTALWDIILFYKYAKFGEFIELKSELTKYIVGKFSETADVVHKKLANIKYIDVNTVHSIISTYHAIFEYYSYTELFFNKKKVLNMNEYVKLFLENVNELQKTTEKFTIKKYLNAILSIKSMEHIMSFLKKETLNSLQRTKAKKNIRLLSLMSTAMTDLSNINTSNISSIGDALTNALGRVNSVNITQVKAVTDMFNAFSSINKSENIITKFTDSINRFTEACKNLMDAMGNNTNAINNIEFGDTYETDMSGVGQNNDGTIFNRLMPQNKKPNSVKITNVDEIANTIAEKINGALSVDMPDTQVQLLINGQGGNEWTITKY